MIWVGKSDVPFDERDVERRYEQTAQGDLAPLVRFGGRHHHGQIVAAQRSKSSCFATLRPIP